MSPSSLENVSAKWVPELQHYASNTPILLVGLKIDMRDEPNLSRTEQKTDWLSSFEPAITRHHEDIKYLMDSKEVAAYMECSAKTQQGLKDVFDKVRVAALSLLTHDLSASDYSRPLCLHCIRVKNGIQCVSSSEALFSKTSKFACVHAFCHRPDICFPFVTCILMYQYIQNLGALMCFISLLCHISCSFVARFNTS